MVELHSIFEVNPSMHVALLIGTELILINSVLIERKVKLSVTGQKCRTSIIFFTAENLHL